MQEWGSGDVAAVITRPVQWFLKLPVALVTQSEPVDDDSQFAAGCREDWWWCEICGCLVPVGRVRASSHPETVVVGD